MAKSPSMLNTDRFRFIISRIKERLWVKPLILCVLSIGGSFIAKLADDIGLAAVLPEVDSDSVESLLSIMASSMLVIATFAVGSMVAAYASASTAATPRSIPLVIADDVTQNALSTFVGAFIFSLVSLVSVQNELFGAAGLFAIFSLTLLVFAIVIVTFVRWVDRIARLGRVVNTIGQVELATARAMDRRRHAPTLCGLPIPQEQPAESGVAVYSTSVGYIQNIDMETLQSCAEEYECRVRVAALPGTFVSTTRPLLFVVGCQSFDSREFACAFAIGSNRTFEDDPRFGLLALSEIADKALSPGVNDPGTAIDVIGTMVRLFTQWQAPVAEEHIQEITCDRVHVPTLDTADMLDDAFTAIARDGAAIIEVSIRLQKALAALVECNDAALTTAAKVHSRRALARSELAMSHQDDIAAVREVARFSTGS